MNRANSKYLKSISIITLMLLLFTSFKSYGTDGVFKAAPLYGKNRQIAKDSIIYVSDTLLSNSVLRAGWGVRKVQNIITFKVDEFANLTLPDSFQVTLKFRFTTTKWIYSTNQPATSITTTADSTLIITYNKTRSYMGKIVLILPDVFSSSVKIVSINPNDTTSNLYKSLMVENEIQTLMDFTSFDCSNNAVQSIFQSDVTVASDGELKVFWATIKEADEYDLEWTYIDSSAVPDYYYEGSSNLDPLKLFDNNASRVTTKSENYYIPLLYDNTGTLFFRVRSVQVKVSGQRIEANWSSVYTAGLGSYTFTGHERKLNWQSTTSFAEDGKRKSIVQYFDGSLRNRQTITKDNTTDTTIIAETFYDNQGRPVIQVLPSPSLNRIIQYTPNFNSDINGVEYDKTHYDNIMTDGADYCNKGADKFGTVGGSSQYYSPQNQNVNNGFNKFIPDAKGYPFTETKYTQDNSGRISAQSGVGANHQLGQTNTIDPADNSTVNHETKYYYGTADQEDLDALFGTEVGNASHYFKNMVRDANGQYSISYVDMHGRTIATALAGTPVNTSLDLLPSNQSRTTTKKLLDSNNNIINGTVIESIKNLIVTKAGVHQFTYSLTPESLQLLDCSTANICYDCLYDLTITITDNCNNQLLPDAQPYQVKKVNFTIPQPDTTCSASPAFSEQFSITLPEGVYSITKRLEISKYASDYYRDSFYLRHNTCKSLQQFITEQKQIILQGLNCGNTCQQCSDSLGTWEQYRVKFIQKLGISSADSAGYRTQAFQSYNTQQEDCDQLCGKQTVIDDTRMNMLADMTAPSGQYANDVTNEEINRDYYSIYNKFSGLSSEKLRFQKPFGNYTNPDGSISNVSDNLPGNLSPKEFDKNFKASWAEALLPYHPEYEKYRKILKLKPSFLWDEKFSKIETFREAYDNGYLNPINNQHIPFDKYPVITNNLDPLYQNTLDSFPNDENFQGIRDDMEIYMEGYFSKQVAQPNLWSFVTIMAKCDIEDISCLENYVDGIHAFDTTGSLGLCKAELDMAWVFFREIYLSKKRGIINDLINKTTAIFPFPGTEHVLHFADVKIFSQDGESPDAPPSSFDPQKELPPTEEDARNLMTSFFNDNCTSFAIQWWRELAPCNYTYDDSLVLLPRLIEVCKQGSDETHPYGSSTVKPGSESPYQSFEEVIKQYNIDNQYPYNISCNTELITSPTPYLQEPAYSNLEISSTPDSCICVRIDSLHNQYTLFENNDTSFSAFVNRTEGAIISDADLNVLLNLCSDTTYCRFLESPIILPPSLQCGVTKSCATCTDVQNLYNSFNTQFPDVLISYEEIDNEQRANNYIFQNYMNHRLGFGKTTQEYLAFIDSCGNFSDSTCDSLQNIVKYFIQNLKPGRVSHSLLTDYNTTLFPPPSYRINYTDLHQIIDSGTIHFPDSVRQLASTSYNNYGISMNGFCTNNGYSAEVRFKFLSGNKTGDVFYTGLGSDLQMTVARNHIDTVGGAYINGLYTRLNGTTYLLDPNTSSSVILNWMTIKVKVLPNMLYFYYNNNLITQIARNPAIAIGNKSSFGLGLWGRQGCIDWIKISDSSGNVKYFEDYNNADYPATVDTSFICPAPANCQTSFVNYFNQTRGTNYTFGQIDSVYLINCGTSPDICSTNSVQDTTATSALFGPRLCGKTEPVFPTITPKQWGPCDDSTNFALIKGTQLFEAYRDSLNDVFSNAYLQKCLAAQKLENFIVTAPVSEYHYTLYFYGQAGNLIKTIPPKAVDISKFSDVSWSTNVGIKRKANQALTPLHILGFATIYRYNSLNQVVAQRTPDAWKSLFWYDRLGRLAISQDTVQRSNGSENGRKYSYTLYDSIGRITEVGEYTNPSTTVMSDVISRNPVLLNSWLGTQANKSQITSTVYDLEYPGWVPPNKQVYAKNLRNRVAYTKYTIGSNTANFNNASFYSYDILGNVDTLIQDCGSSSISGNENIMNLNFNRWQKIVYQYDLVSGKVNFVAYQPQYRSGNTLYRRNDAFYHKYEYDAENRLTAVFTSTDSVMWEKDARYEYYKHGPLARTTLGDQLVQGIDYAYTLQGWLKGVNSISLLSANDIGQDGNTVTGQKQNQFIAKDDFGFNLNYFTGDYTAINNTVMPFPGSSAYLSTSYRPLYNGNISSMAVNINNLTIPGGVANAGGAILYNYKYDQLNRITAMDAYTGLANNNWEALSLKDEYQERIAYDANGNILKYLRNGNKSGGSLRMDSLSYKYNSDVSTKRDNQLNYVKDNIATATYASPDADIDGQSASNYLYYANGNLYRDNVEKISAIYWNVYGKITIINFSNTANNTTKNIYYFYDASQNRVGSRVEKNSATSVTNSVYSWYVRDASGNVMATYNSTSTGNSYPYNLAVSERHLYGSSRLGILNSTSDVRTTPTSVVTSGYNSSFSRGNKFYELSNHLGNVLVTISDKKIGHNGGSGVDYYNADVIAAQDYYPFGMLMPGRKYSASSSKYRYGFNGKENDNDVKGEGNQQDYGMRIYDSRLGRFLSVDPIAKDYPELTPYQFASNTPIFGIDKDGLEVFGNDWIFNIWLDWMFGDPTGIKTLESGFEEKAAVQTKQTSYHNDNVPSQLQNKLDHINNIQANVKIAAGTSKVVTFNIKTSFDVISTVAPIGEGIAVSLKGAEIIYGGIRAERVLVGSSNKIAVIGRDFDARVMKFAAGFEKQTGKKVETFQASKEALEEWNLVSKNGTVNVSEEVAKGLKIYNENSIWAEKVKKEGYKVLDTGLGTKDGKGTFYKMETKTIFGDK